MSESFQHSSYVKIICDFVKTFLSQQNLSLLNIDSQTSDYKPPRITNGFMPDVYYKYEDNLIIGEAKTDNDVMTKHSMEQYLSYFREAILFSKKSTLIFCVSWKEYATMKNIVRRLKRNNHQFNKVKTFVLNDKGDVSQIWQI